MNSNQAIFLLDCPKDDLIAGRGLALAAPDDVVALQPVPKVSSVQLVEDRPQVEKAALLDEGKLPLEGSFAMESFRLRVGHGGRYSADLEAAKD
jgi:hypothetical protein